MAALSPRERARLPDSAFAYVDSAGRRRLPIHDEAHVRNALARFGRVEFEDERARDRARTRLLKAAKKYGIVPIGFIDTQLRPRLPTGTVTLLFADLEASSRLLGELGERYSAMMSTVRRILRTRVRRLGGYEVDARADEFLAVFTDPLRALDAAVATQREIEAASWPDGRSVRVRIGLHTGRPTLTDTGYVGLAVNAGARICEAGHGGQILVSRATRTALGEAVDHRLRSLGSHRLRGIGEEELFQVTEQGLPDSFPPLRTGL